MHSRSSDTWGNADALASVLLDLRLTGTFFCRSEFAAPWSLQIAERDFVSFHVCVSRECWLHVGTRSSFVHLTAGDLALVPGSTKQVLSSSQRKSGSPLSSLPSRTLTAAVSTLRVPGRAAPWVVICGGVRLEGFAATMLIDVLPDVLVVRAADTSELGTAVLAAMQRESEGARAGSATVMTRLADVLIVHAIRDWIERTTGASAWLAALRDPLVGRAVASVHRKPERAWSVAQLARIAGLSRSRFSERFSELSGIAPMQYVTRVQMHRAAELLRVERPTIAQLATRFGYESEPAFARAFKRHMGMPPGAARRARP